MNWWTVSPSCVDLAGRVELFCVHLKGVSPELYRIPSGISTILKVSTKGYIHAKWSEVLALIQPLVTWRFPLCIPPHLFPLYSELRKTQMTVPRGLDLNRRRRRPTEASANHGRQVIARIVKARTLKLSGFGALGV